MDALHEAGFIFLFFFFFFEKFSMLALGLIPVCFVMCTLAG